MSLHTPTLMTTLDTLPASFTHPTPQRIYPFIHNRVLLDNPYPSTSITTSFHASSPPSTHPSIHPFISPSLSPSFQPALPTSLACVSYVSNPLYLSPILKYLTHWCYMFDYL